MSKRWPLSESYQKRYFVPDLVPKSGRIDTVFVAESPHVSEVEPEVLEYRRPLCGKAGREWWPTLSRLTGHALQFEGEILRRDQLALCSDVSIAVINAVQYPLDPKITVAFGTGADPVWGLGFSKVPPHHYKKLRRSDAVVSAVAALRSRLTSEVLRDAYVVSLGRDAEWFVTEALLDSAGTGRHLSVIAHPSAWWRQGGKLRIASQATLHKIFEWKLMGCPPSSRPEWSGRLTLPEETV